MLEVIRELGATGRAAGVCVCPQGFVSDHLEVLYDLDIEATQVADGGRPGLRPHPRAQRRSRRLGALADRVLARRMSHVVVVGGGIAGLAAAHEVTAQGGTVTVVERDERVGGKLRTSPFAGRLVDDGADAFLLRVPWALDLCREVGIEGELVHPGGPRGLRVEPRRAAPDAPAAHGRADGPRRARGQRPRVARPASPGPVRT